MWWLWIVVWAIHLLLWFVLANQFSLHELIAGSIAAGIAVVGYVAVWRHGHIPFAPRWRDAMQFWHVPWEALLDSGRVLYGAALELIPQRRPASGLVAVPFHWGGDDPHEVARRALAITYITFTPNTVVLDILPPSKGQKRAMLLYHQMLPGPLTAMARTLGAGEGAEER